jgi:PRTRC genetic system protein C
MAKVTSMRRVFKIGSLDLPDPSPKLNIDDIRRHYAPNFPGLSSPITEVKGPVTDPIAGTITYTFDLGAKPGLKG